MKIAILGAGTWGTALARMLSINNHEVTLWSAIEKELDCIAQTHAHPNLKNVTIPANIIIEKEIKNACNDRDIIVFAVPSVHIRNVAKLAAEFIPDGCIIVNVSKGIEADTFKFMSEIIEEELYVYQKNTKVVTLSGPTHAEEVSNDLPTAIVSACSDITAAETVQAVFSNNVMRVYTNGDDRGVELCGALKNIIALAAGMSEGLGYGDNTKAALITRGMAEIARLGKAMSCDERTFYGLSGVGDLIVTATSRHSRNNRAGYLIGQGMQVDEAIKQVGMVVEGINALPAAVGLAKKFGTELPIIFAVDDIVNNNADPCEKVKELMNREYKIEAIG